MILYRDMSDGPILKRVCTFREVLYMANGICKHTVVTKKFCSTKGQLDHIVLFMKAFECISES